MASLDSHTHILANPPTCTRANLDMKVDPACLLVVDDNEMNRDLLTRRLQRQGHEVVTAVNGRDALVKLDKYTVDLILLDIMMPEMNGYELLTILKADDEKKYIPVIVISAANDMESIVKGIELGAEDYLPKPFNPMLLKARIRASLDKKRLVDQEHARHAEMATMQQIDAELNATLDVRRVMEITLEWAMRQTKAEAGVMGIVVDKQVEVLASQGYSYEASAANSILLPDEFPALQKACHHGKLAYIANTDGVGLLARTHSQIAVPIRRESQSMAVILLESTQPNYWDKETLSFLERLSTHAAIAVANAQLYEMVQSANEAKTEFVSFVSHELKTPMTTIKGYTDLLLSNNFGDTNAAQAQFLQTVRANIDRMTCLVSDLEDVARIESGGLKLDSEAVSVHRLVEEVAQSTQAQIESKDQTLQLDIPENMAQLYGDWTRLVQILSNLVSNAYKYTPQNGRIVIRANQTMEMNGHQKMKQMVHMTVEDNGFGIREEDQDEIFSKFFRGNDDQILEISGTGLGLNITKTLVEMHNGRIWFESKHRQGTAFHIILPAVAEPELVR